MQNVSVVHLRAFDGKRFVQNILTFGDLCAAHSQDTGCTGNMKLCLII